MSLSETKQEAHSSAIQVFVEVFLFLLYVITQCVVSVVKFCIPLSFKTKKDIEGNVALVTGAGSGIGRLTALRLARLKVKVVIWDINEPGKSWNFRYLKCLVLVKLLTIPTT